jgi:hypothetical protein
MTFVDRVGAVRWDKFVQPKENAPEDVPRALVAIWQAADSASSTAAYHQFLYAIGNNHAGTFCPVVMVTLPFLREILRTGSPVAQSTAIEVLTDLYGSFSPDPEYVDSEGARRLKDQVECVVRAFRDAVEVIAGGGGVNAKLAGSFLELLDGSHGYDEPSVLTEYVWSQCHDEMTDLERAGLKVMHARSQAAATDSERMRRMILEKWGSNNDPAVTAALAGGEEAFRIAVRDRVLRDHPEVVKRWPKCYRVLRTPRARQCRWCFHAWHDR